jgi:large subunit ribosomal protein L9
MKVILLSDIRKIGKKHEVKNVSDGHALNLLIPKGLVEPATPGALKKLECVKVELERHNKVQEELLLKNLDAIKDSTVTIKGEANEKGHLFKGIHKEEIVSEIEKETRISLHSDYLELEKPIKELGTHELSIKVQDKIVKINLVVEKA